MASLAIPRPILRLPFRTSLLRPFSTSCSNSAASQSPSSPPTRPPVENLANLVNSYTNPSPNPGRTTSQPMDRASLLASTESLYRAADLERYIYRRYRPGDIYAPHDLSSVEQQKWRNTSRRTANKGAPLLSSKKSVRHDAFDVLDVHPLAEFKNFAMMGEFVTSMGRIKHRRETGLRGVNQRRAARAVRRAVGMGLLPSVHKHPEMLEKEAMDLRRRAAESGGGGGVFRGSRRRGFM